MIRNFVHKVSETLVFASISGTFLVDECKVSHFEMFVVSSTATPP